MAGATLPKVMEETVWVEKCNQDSWAASLQPNLVYIMADQLRACSVGSYGNGEISTPSIDRLAAEGVRFTNAVTSSPLCVPHRGCLMTGRYPIATGVTDNKAALPANESCLAEVYRDHGYITGYFGKWHLDGVPEDFDMCVDPGWVPPQARQGFIKWLGFNHGHVYYGGQYYLNQDATLHTIPKGIYEPDFQTEAAINFIKANRERRFCVFLSIGTPHGVADCVASDLPPGGDYLFPYDPDELTLRPNMDYADPDYARQEYADYYGMVSNFDWNVGRIMQTLEDLRLAGRTILVVTSDHGDLLGSHNLAYEKFRGKSVVEAESLDVPFILRFPNRVTPVDVDHVFSSVDIMPTLLGMSGLPIPVGVMGRDFTPVMIRDGRPSDPPFGRVPSPASALLGVGWSYGWAGLRTPRYSFASLYSTLEPIRFYDNMKDPYQLRNLIDHPDYQSIKEKLTEQLSTWLNYVDSAMRYPASNRGGVVF